MLRFLFRLTWLTSLIFLCVPLHLLWRLLRLNSPWPQRFLGWCWCARHESQNYRRKSSGNNLVRRQSPELDGYPAHRRCDGRIPCLEGTRKKWPIAGWLAPMVGTICIANSDRRAAGAQAERTREVLMVGKSGAFFPKGKHNNGTMLIFRPALFGAAIPPVDHTGVQPIALDYGVHAKELIWPGGSHAAINARRIFAHRGHEDVTVHLLTPIAVAEDSHCKDVAEQCETAIANAFGHTIKRNQP